MAAAVLAATFLLAVAGGSFGAAHDTAIDTAAPVSPANCAPCHMDLGDVDVPGLTFSHGNHLLVSCDGCHSRMPHRDDATERVPMEVCFACHGITHGGQGELATRVCRDCHPGTRSLRPRDHSKEFAAKPHADAAKRLGVNSCMMCHTGPSECDDCHKKQGVDVGAMPSVYHPVITPLPKGASVKIFPRGKVTMSQCVYCHADLDSITPGRLIFAHATHLSRNYRCEACHPKFAHNEDGIRTPDMLSCYRCHGLQHQGQGQVAAEDCLKCHPKSFQLVPANHTRGFIRGEHGERARKDPAYCAMCHPQEQFCVDCHRGKKTSVNAPGKPVVPKDHRTAKWKTQHGPLYLNAQGQCGACHDGKSCQRCHFTVMPHPVGWLENHRPPKGTPEGDCDVCHSDRSKCQNCHHQGVLKAELILENCIKCHPEMKQRPATAIKNKGFAEHAVHFDVHTKKSKYQKDRAYRCYECHVDFGDSAEDQAIEAQQGHDLRLCYDCHGRLDIDSKLVAPYRGAELCVQCHGNI